MIMVFRCMYESDTIFQKKLHGRDLVTFFYDLMPQTGFSCTAVARPKLNSMELSKQSHNPEELTTMRLFCYQANSFSSLRNCCTTEGHWLTDKKGSLPKRSFSHNEVCQNETLLQSRKWREIPVRMDRRWVLGTKYIMIHIQIKPNEKALQERDIIW